MSLRQAAAALRVALPRVAARQAASETGVAARTTSTTTARTLKTTAAPRDTKYHYVSRLSFNAGGCAPHHRGPPASERPETMEKQRDAPTSTTGASTPTTFRRPHAR